MKELLRKTRAYLAVLNRNRRIVIDTITDIGIFPCGYKSAGELPTDKCFVPFNTQKDRWGEGTDTHAWFKFCVEIPERFTPDQLCVRVSTDQNIGWNVDNPQFIVYVDGKMLQGLDVNHTEFFLPSGGAHTVYLYAYTGARAQSSSLGIELLQICRNVEKLWYDIKIPCDSVEHLDENSGEYRKILDKLNGALCLLDMYRVPSEDFYRSVDVACEYMENEFYGKLCSAPREGDPQVIGIGHTHIDCAWLWTLKQTREKVQRSFSTVVELMRQYPEYKFMSSQAFLYKNLKEESPEIYAEVKKLIAEGRWECEGAMWVEADCNLSSGESLVRQILYGKGFFKKEFGVDNRILWLPDVFGYSAALPQILKKSGVDWFVTSKISWNDTNKMPYDTFMWQGIDGTRINTYFLTAQDKKRNCEPANFTTYNGFVTPAQIAGTYDRYQQKELSDKTLITYGYGDGGGGPTAGYLETARRLSKGIPGTPAMRMGFAGEFLSQLEKKIKNNPRLPVWQGELYLEYHRGTYTSIGKNKKNNRRSESLYLDTELLCSMNNVLLGKAFPKDTLHKGWEMILTNQFHDIIPGSSIHEVYEQCDIDYAEIKRIAEVEKYTAMNDICDNIDKKHGYVVFNTNPTKGCGIVKMHGKSVFVDNVPTNGFACVNIENIKDTNSITVGKKVCENSRYRIEFNVNMLLTSIYDKENGREILKPSALGNELRVYADYPDKYDAWEWNDFSMDNYITINDVSSVEEIVDGARAGLRLVRKHMDSTVTQTIWLYDDIDRIDFETDIDWQERHQMLKVAFPVDINASHATYEIQYGTIERPTHKNTSWDRAKFEVCGHRFADLSDGGYGVTLLNDCKYGYDIHDGVMMLSLLRSPSYPDPQADIGKMSCTYSIYPHSGRPCMSEIYSMAYDLNNPMILCEAKAEKDSLPTEFSMVKSNCKNILCEVVKQAEESDELIFRFYENSNTKTKSEICFGFDINKVELCDMMENSLEELDTHNRTVHLDFGAFEIHTLKVYVKK